jgi:HEAT repeat protein
MFKDPPDLDDPMRPPTSEPPSEHLRWVLGNGLGIFADLSVADDLVELAIDRSYGHARTQIVLALPKTKDARVPDILLGLLDDPTVAAFAVEALGKTKLARARDRIEEQLHSPDKNVRDQARKALKRIDSAAP